MLQNFISQVRNSPLVITFLNNEISEQTNFLMGSRVLLSRSAEIEQGLLLTLKHRDLGKGTQDSGVNLSLLTLAPVSCILMKTLSESAFIFPEFQLSTPNSNKYGCQKPPTHYC